MSASEITAAPVAWPRAGRWGVLPVVLAGTFMVVLDFFVVNVALPAIQGGLGAGAGAVEWVVAGYGLSFATLLITAGRLGDRFGRRRLFSLGLALFTLASAACGVAWSPGALVAARVLQGAAAALLAPQVLSIIGVAYQGQERARALGVYGLVLGLAAAGGQLLGGVLVVSLGWRACFLVNLPIGVAALAAAPRLVPESRSGTRGLDGAGTVLLTAGLVALVLGLVEGRPHGWPLWTWLSLAASLPLLGAFAVQQRRLGARGGAPLLDPALLRTHGVAAGLVAQLAFWCGQAAFFLVLALYLQQGRGLDALGAGLVFTVLAVSYLATSLRAPELTARFGRRLIRAGALTLALGHLALLATVAAVGVGGNVLVLAPALLAIGAGMGLCITPLTALVLAHVEPRHAGAASGALATVQQVGNALGVAVTGVIFFGALHRGAAVALELSLAELAAVLLGVAALTRVLPAAD